MRRSPISIFGRGRFVSMRRPCDFSERDVLRREGPHFWWPYMYQSLDDAFSFTVAPAYLSSWGPSLLTQVTFPITDQIKGRLRLDYRGRRGVAIGFDSNIEYGKDNNSWARLKTYYIQDQNPNLNQTAGRARCSYRGDTGSAWKIGPTLPRVSTVSRTSQNERCRSLCRIFTRASFGSILCLTTSSH
jgi:hypothetical protein